MTGPRVAASTARRLLSLTLNNVAGPSALIRPLSTSSVQLFGPRFVPTPPSFDADVAPKKDTDIKNEAIRSKFLRLVDPVSGGLAGPFNTRHLLNKLDLDNFYLQQVTAGVQSGELVEWDERNPPKDGFDVTQLKQFPVCKIINKKEEIQRQLARKAAKRAQKSEESAAAAEAEKSDKKAVQLSAKGTSKEVHITWTTTPHDLSHKLSSMKTQLLKGSRINVVIANKGKGRFYTPGKDPKRDHEYHRLIAQVDDFMCRKDALTPAQLNKVKGKQEIDITAPLATSQITSADETVAKRVNDVEWKYNRGLALLTYDTQTKG